jgi:hypothetical protein
MIKSYWSDVCTIGEMDGTASPAEVAGSQAADGKQQGDEQRPLKQRRVVHSGGYGGQGTEELRETLKARYLQIAGLKRV